MAGHTVSDHHPRWPKDVCHRCGETIQFVRVKGTSRWLAYDAHPFARHHCGDALDVARDFITVGRATDTRHAVSTSSTRPRNAAK